jgi:hypothetical protein
MKFDYGKLVVGQRIALGYKGKGCNSESFPNKVRVGRMSSDFIISTVFDSHYVKYWLVSKVVYTSSDYVLIDISGSSKYKSILLNHEVQL